MLIYICGKKYKHLPPLYFFTLPEEGWFGQPKYSTLKFNSTLYRFLLQSTIDPTYTSRIIVHACLLGDHKSLSEQLLKLHVPHTSFGISLGMTGDFRFG